LSLQPELQQRLWKLIAGSLGAEFSAKMDRQFDESFARKEARCYAFADVPQPPPVTNPAVSNVRFRTNLATAAPLERSVSATIDALLS
jgi:hypothetical protein